MLMTYRVAKCSSHFLMVLVDDQKKLVRKRDKKTKDGYKKNKKRWFAKIKIYIKIKDSLQG